MVDSIAVAETSRVCPWKAVVLSIVPVPAADPDPPEGLEATWVEAEAEAEVEAGAGAEVGAWVVICFLEPCPATTSNSVQDLYGPK